MRSETLKSAITQLKTLFNSEHSDFYRQKYEGNTAVRQILQGDESIEAWNSVPFLTREDVWQAPYRSRLFKSFDEAGILRVTSGTSGKGVLVMPRLNEGDDIPELLKEVHKTIDCRRLATFSGAQFQQASVFRNLFLKDSIQLDPQDMSLSANMVRNFRPDHLGGFAYSIEALAEELTGDSLLKDVKAIQIFGEKCSGLQWDLLQEKFPQAVLFAEYSSIDAQTTIGFPCLNIISEKERHVHMVSEFVHSELVHSETDEAIVKTVGATGELVVTVLRDVAFPLIRYRTGDIATVVKESCDCGRGAVYSIEGRLHMDKVRFSGGELNAAEADRVFRILKRFGIKDNFCLRYREVKNKRAVTPQVTAELEWDTNSISADDLAKEIEKELFIAPQKSYQSGVLNGQCLPLRVAFVPHENVSGKRIRIIREE